MMMFFLILFLLILLLLGVPIAFSLGIVSLAGLMLTEGLSGLSAISDIAWGSTSEFLLVAIPLFVLMGELISVSGVGADLFKGIERWFGRLPGGMAMSAVIASAVFGAVSGTAVGVAAVISGIAIPEMLRRNYSREMASGTVAAASGLGMVIPPSLPLIIYGVVTETSIAELFAKSILPGLIITAIFCIYILLHTIMRTRKGEVITTTGGSIGLLESLLKAGPTAILIILVLGSIYQGIATPTEAAAVGAFGSLILAACKRTLSIRILLKIINTTAQVSWMLLTILLTAMLFSYMLSSTQVPQMLTQQVVDANLPGWLFFVLVMILLFILGMFLDVISVVLISVPIIFPPLIAYGYDPVWFGVILMINMCFAVITPPVGLCLYVVRDCVKGLELGEVIRGTLPFIVLYALAIALFTVFPSLVTG